MSKKYFQMMALLPLVLLFALSELQAQDMRQIRIEMPEVELYAHQLLRGDGDTYGLGDWHGSFRVRLEGTSLILQGDLVFSEKANDFTTIAGSFLRKMDIECLKTCGHCLVSIDRPTGEVGGNNIGARGYRWFAGQGLLSRAFVQTDTYGSDVGLIGGKFQFHPLHLLLDCRIAASF